jgi:hypothetical protein
VSHLEKLGVVPLEVLDALAREGLGTLFVDSDDEQISRFGRDARHLIQQRMFGSRPRLHGEEPVEHPEASHDERRIPDVHRAARDHVEKLRIVPPEVPGDLCHAGVRTQLVELPGDALSGGLGDTRKRAHRR